MKMVFGNVKFHHVNGKRMMTEMCAFKVLSTRRHCQQTRVWFQPAHAKSPELSERLRNQQALTNYEPIWQCVKTLYPCSSHQNSWDLWMFIPLKMVLIGIDPYPHPKDLLLFGSFCKTQNAINKTLYNTWNNKQWKSPENPTHSWLTFSCASTSFGAKGDSDSLCFTSNLRQGLWNEVVTGKWSQRRVVAEDWHAKIC